MAIGVDVALKGPPLLVVQELVCDGQCLDIHGNIVEVKELRHDKCRCSEGDEDVEGLADPTASTGVEGTYKSPEEILLEEEDARTRGED